MNRPLVFLIAAISADGFIARETEQFADWSSKEDKKLFVELTKDAGVMVMGSTTYNMFPKELPGRKHIVYSRNPKDSSSENTVFTNIEPEKLIDELGNEGYKKIAVIGGRQIYDLFLKDNIIDEVYLVVEPYLFGSGVKLATSSLTNRMELLETRPLNEHTFMLHYKLIK